MKRRPRKHRVKCKRPACDVRFTPGRRDQEYHNTSCRNKHWRELHPRVMIVEEQDGQIIGRRTGRIARVVLHERVGRKK